MAYDAADVTLRMLYVTCVVRRLSRGKSDNGITSLKPHMADCTVIKPENVSGFSCVDSEKVKGCTVTRLTNSRR